MKNIYLLFVLIAVTVSTAFSQVPDAFNYQAVVRDASGGIVANQEVTFRISILQDSESGAVVFSETHLATTNAFGLANFKIGRGTLVNGSFDPSTWGSGSKFIKVEIDPAGGSAFTELGTSELVSVPYAFRAESVANDQVDDADADPANEIQTLSLNGTLLELSNGGGSVTLPTSGGGGGDNWGAQTVKTDATLTGDGTATNPLSVVADGDGDNTNELQTLSKSGNSIQLSNGGGTVTDEVDDADADPANEIQSLSVSGNDLSISDGNTVALPGSPWTETSEKIEYMGDKTVYIGDASMFSLKTKSALRPNPPKFQISTGSHTAIDVYNETSVYPALTIWNEEGTAARFGSNSDKPVAIFDNNDVGLAAEFRNAIQIEDGNEGDGKVLTSDANGVASWQTPAGGGTSLWSQNSSDIYYNSGKVGIGAIPSGSIQFQSITNNSIIAIKGVNNSDNYGTLYLQNDGNGPAADLRSPIKIQDGTQGDGKVLTSDANGVASWQTPASGGSSLWTENGVNIYRSSGNVGIGTSSPSFMLDIQSSGTAPIIGVKATSSILNAHFVVDRGGSSTYGDIIFRTGGVNKFYTGLEKTDNYWISNSTSSLSGLEVTTTGVVNTSNNLNVSNNFNVDGDAFFNQNLEVSDDLTVGIVTVSAGEVNKSTTGTTNNLLPFAYGTITSSGSKSGCTSNVGTVTRVSAGQFVVSIAGLGSDYSIIVTPVGTTAFTTGAVMSKGTSSVTVAVWDTKNDIYYDGGFSFVVYKP